MEVVDQLSKFMIFADARTGGTHVMAKLNSHPDVFSVSEPFPHLNLNTHKEQIEWVDEFFSNTKNRTYKSIGFRTKIEHQADLGGFVDYIKQNNIICFSLQRRNFVKKAISRINAVKLFKETKDYNRKNKDFKSVPQVIKVNELLKEIRICEKQLQVMDDFLRELPVVSVLYYEEMLVNEDEFFSRILNKLGLEMMPLKTTVFKNTSDDLSKSIDNFEEVRDRLLTTSYLSDLEEILIK